VLDNGSLFQEGAYICEYVSTSTPTYVCLLISHTCIYIFFHLYIVTTKMEMIAQKTYLKISKNSERNIMRKFKHSMFTDEVP
jgi:hypothetical protein